MSRRITDSNAEQELALFLDQYLYPHLNTHTQFTYTRAKTREEQLKGVDIIASNTRKSYYIDEKAQLYYINKSLPTFAFEVDSIQKEVYRKGWLINDELITDYYLLIWPYAVHTDLTKIKYYDFTKLECLMILKSKVIHYLMDAEWDEQRLTSLSRKLSESKYVGKYEIDHPDFYMYKSDAKKYNEAPTNLVIYRKTLRELADAEYIVTPSTFERIV
jgi:hypothetical protein